MPVTHSPGNPFAFSPAVPRGPTYDDADVFQHYKSPLAAMVSPSPVKRVSNDAAERSEYALKEYKEFVAQDLLHKDTRIAGLERQLLEENKKMERTESDKRFLYDLQEKQAAEIASLKEELAQTHSTYDSTMSALRTSNTHLKESEMALQDELRARNQAQQRELDTMQVTLDGQKRAIEALKHDLAAKNDTLVDKNAHIESLERRCDEFAVSQITGTPEDLAFVTKQLADALAKALSLEDTNSSQIARIQRLQEANARIPVLMEEKASLERKSEACESVSVELAAAQVRIDALEAEKATWTDLLDGNDDIDLPNLLTRRKAEVSACKTQIALLEEQLNDANVLVSTLREDLQRSSDSNDVLAHDLAHAQRTHARIERAKTMADREIAFLRQQLASYDLEEQVETPNFDALKAERITTLQTLLDEMRASQQIDSPPAATLGTKRPRESSDFNDIERGEYLRKIRTLNAELEITRGKTRLLQQDVARLTTPRILEYRKNPTTTYHATRTQLLTDLRAENDALLAGIKASGVVSVPIQSLRNAETEIARLGGVVAQKEKMMTRLKTVFSDKSSEFREAVYSLLGYKLEFLPNGRVRCRSMYATQHDFAFIFDGEEGTMQLSTGEGDCEPALMAKVRNLIQFWSDDKHSIPGMLSALTLELLDKQE